MSKNIPAGILTAAQQQMYRPHIFVEINYKLVDNTAGCTRLWDGTYDFTYSGNTFIGAGNLLDVKYAKETTEVSANGAVIELSGIAPETLSTVLGTTVRGEVCKIYNGILTEAGTLVEGALFLVFSGLNDSINIEEGKDFAQIKLNAENGLTFLGQPKIWNMSHAHQQRLVPYGDDCCIFVQDLADKRIIWGVE